MGCRGAALRDAGNSPPLELARAVFATAVAERPAARFMIRSRTRVVTGKPGIARKTAKNSVKNADLETSNLGGL